MVNPLTLFCVHIKLIRDFLNPTWIGEIFGSFCYTKKENRNDQYLEERVDDR